MAVDRVQFDLGVSVDFGWTTQEIAPLANPLLNIFAWDYPTFPPGQTDDIIATRFRLAAAPDKPTKLTPFVEIPRAPGAPSGVINLAEHEEYAGLDGDFNLAASAVDDGGNEAAMAELSDVPLDLVPPPALVNFRRLSGGSVS